MQPTSSWHLTQRAFRHSYQKYLVVQRVKRVMQNKRLYLILFDLIFDIRLQIGKIWVNEYYLKSSYNLIGWYKIIET